MAALVQMSVDPRYSRLIQFAPQQREEFFRMRHGGAGVRIVNPPKLDWFDPAVRKVGESFLGYQQPP